jgi:hypothetical protein
MMEGEGIPEITSFASQKKNIEIGKRADKSAPTGGRVNLLNVIITPLQFGTCVT